MEIIKKQRINYTVTTTVIAAIFLLVVLGGLFGVVYGSNDMFINKALDKALEDPENYNNAVANDLRCIFIYKYDDGRNPYIDGKVDVYGDDATDIVLKAITVGDGKFKYNDRHFIVANRQYPNGTLYALIDRTSYHKQLTNTAVMVTLLYCCSVVFVALLALLSSARLLFPVASAMTKQRDLIANASHELKTPLTIIATNLSVIKSEPDSTVKDNEKWIASISTQLVRMRDLINSMLELSKLEQSELPKQDAVVNFNVKLDNGEFVGGFFAYEAREGAKITDVKIVNGTLNCDFGDNKTSTAYEWIAKDASTTLNCDYSGVTITGA